MATTSPYQSHPILGWSGRPGFNGVLDAYPETSVRLSREGWRDPFVRTDPKAKGVTIYGCSYAFGVGVEMPETFIGLLAQRMSDMSIQPRAQPGYGTVQAYQLLRRDLVSPSRPSLAIYAMLDVHLRRNTATPMFATRFGRPHAAGHENNFHLPKASYDLSGGLTTTTVARPGLTAELAAHPALRPDPYYLLSVAESLILAMKVKAEAFGTRFAVAMLRTDREGVMLNALLPRLKGAGVDLIDIAFPRAPDTSISKRDYHPNTLGHKMYADRLMPELLKRVTP